MQNSLDKLGMNSSSPKPIVKVCSGDLSPKPPEEEPAGDLSCKLTEKESLIVICPAS